MTPRAVVDPGVIVSALLSGSGAPALVLDAWRRRHFELVVSEELLTELADVLARPKFTGRVTLEERIAVIALLAEEAINSPDVPVAHPPTEDPDDDYLVALATSSGAQFLITGDTALLRWRSESVIALTPRGFLDELEKG